MNGISIALIVHSLDYYNEPTFTLLIGGLISYFRIIENSILNLMIEQGNLSRLISVRLIASTVDVS